MKLDYFGMYLEKAKEHGFIPSEARGIIRYLLVNGLIESTPEHLAIMGDTEFYLDARHIPEDVKKQALEFYEKNPENADYSEEVEIEEIEIHGHKLEGGWFSDGNMNSFRVCVSRTVKVETTYHIHTQEEEQ